MTSPSSAKQAQALLEKAGFSAAENRAVIRAAVKNHQNPIGWARKAIALRTHVEAGLPLNEKS